MVDGPLVLVVDDEQPVLDSVRLTLRSHGIDNVRCLKDSTGVLHALAEREPAAMLLDLNMPEMRGEEVLRQVAAHHPAVPVVVVTATYDVPVVVQCLRLGAADFLTKPVEPGLLVATVRRVLDEQAVRQEAERLKDQLLGAPLGRSSAFDAIVTHSERMLRVFSYIEAIAPGSHPALIVGETGTGKELLAQSLHRASGRDGPFVPVNVAGLDDEMFADTLFGHAVGAFTGAQRPRAGMIEQARGGTLFLDEIGDLSEASQVKLLRVIQEREYLPLGSDHPRPVQARVVTATHRDPATLRTDLYYRLRAYHVRLPALRERVNDLPFLLDHFLRQAADDLGRAVPDVPDELYEVLSHYPFPGNIRELQSMTFHAVARSAGGPLQVQDFVDQMEREPSVAPAPSTPGAAGAPTVPGPLASFTAQDERVLTRDELADLERENIERALRRTDWKVSGPGGAAELLQMNQSTLASRIRTLKIQRR